MILNLIILFVFFWLMENKLWQRALTECSCIENFVSSRTFFQNLLALAQWTKIWLIFSESALHDAYHIGLREDFGFLFWITSIVFSLSWNTVHKKNLHFLWIFYFQRLCWRNPHGQLGSWWYFLRRWLSWLKLWRKDHCCLMVR